MSLVGGYFILRFIEEVALMRRFIQTFAADQSGATAIEYGLIVALIAVVIIGAVTTLGTKLKTTFTSVSATL